MMLRLQFLLAGLILLTTAAIVQKAMGVAAPQPVGDAPRSLQLAGYKVQSLGSRAGRRSRELSHGPIQRFILQPQKGGNPMLLTLIPIRHRTEATLDLAGLAAIEPSFSIKSRRLLEIPFVAGDQGTARVDQVAIGVASKAPNDLVRRLQTCLPASGVGAVEAGTLNSELIRQRNFEWSRSPVHELFVRHLGHKPNPSWECLAVQLETRGLSDSDITLLHTWSKLRGSLKE